MYLKITDGELSGIYKTKKDAEESLPLIVKARNEWYQCTYCGEWFFGRKKRFCSKICLCKFWKKIENDSAKAVLPYYQNATNENGRRLEDTMKYGVRYEQGKIL